MLYKQKQTAAHWDTDLEDFQSLDAHIGQQIHQAGSLETLNSTHRFL